MDQIKEANNKFAINLYKQIVSKKPDGNLIFSPLSATTALAMVQVGAKGNSFDQLSAVTFLPKEVKLVADGFLELVPVLKSGENSILEVANGVFIQKDFAVVKEFLEIMEKHFKSNTANLDFIGDKGSSVAHINKWVDEKTRQKIKDLITEDMINQDTALVLVNAVYFKGHWKHKFDKAATKDRPFFVSDTKSIDVPMMHQKQDFLIGDLADLDARALEMPYKDEKLSFLIILPNKRTGLAALEAKLHQDKVDVNHIRKRLSKNKVEVQIPRFKLEETIKLVEILKSLGVTDIFCGKAANLKGISDKEKLFVSEAIQKAFIEVNEEGSEAAAATAIRIQKRSLEILPDPIIVDRPFLFYLLCQGKLEEGKDGRLVLFNGRIANPSLLIDKTSGSHVESRSKEEL